MRRSHARTLPFVASLLVLGGVAKDVETPLPLSTEKPVKAYLPQWLSNSRSHGGSTMHYKATSGSANAFHSQDGEDEAALQHYFHDMHSGVFLEMGALDGVKFSNTLFLERERSWRGLLIEPNPEEFENIPASRPEAISVNVAICDQRQTLHFAGRKGDASIGSVGGIWVSSALSGPPCSYHNSVPSYLAHASPADLAAPSFRLLKLAQNEFMPPNFRKQHHGSADEMPKGTVEITCLPLASVLQMFGLTYIDFFSLDVEGAELKVLQTLEFSAVRINVMVVEQDGHNPEKDEAVRALLLANEFELDERLRGDRAAGKNEWFVNRHFRPFAKPLHS